MNKLNFFTSVILLCICHVLSYAQPILKFHNGKFKIVQFTDIHWEENIKSQKWNDSTLLLIKYIIEIEKPDLVIFTGDIVTSKPSAIAWKKLTQPMIDYKVPFAITFGNHDTETDLSKEKTLEIIQTNPYNLTYNASRKLSGIGNCALSVKSGDGKVNRWILYLFDSHAYPKDTIYGHYDWIKNNQVQWYRKESIKYSTKAKSALPSLAFFHIPLPEYEIVRTQNSTIGNKSEQVCSSSINSGLFASFIEMHDVFGIFTGHDHNNDFIGQLNNIWLAYGRKTGYVPAYEEILKRGGRIIELLEDDCKFNTYIRTLDDTSFFATCRK
jgi:hypothetical protein